MFHPTNGRNLYKWLGNEEVSGSGRDDATLRLQLTPAIINAIKERVDQLSSTSSTQLSKSQYTDVVNGNTCYITFDNQSDNEMCLI
jgi:hypothetical protein